MSTSSRKCGKKARNSGPRGANVMSIGGSDKEVQEATGYLKPSRCLTLPTKYSEAIQENGNDQQQSLLFSKLPGEIRNRIFELVCLPYDDPTHKYNQHDYWYRPGYHAKHITRATGLLLSCRRAWIEANDLPMRLSQPTFWFKNEDRTPGWARRHPLNDVRQIRQARMARFSDSLASRADSASSRGSPHSDYDQTLYNPMQTEEARLALFTNNLTLENRKNFQSLRIFAQMFWLEHEDWKDVMHESERKRSSFPNGLPAVIWPRRVIFAIRNTDWWYWETDNPLSMEDGWISELLKTISFRTVESFVLELEVLDTPAKLMQLRMVLDRIRSNHTMVDNWILQPGAGEEILRWTRPGNIDGFRPTPHAYQKYTKLDYRVVGLEWINSTFR